MSSDMSGYEGANYSNYVKDYKFSFTQNYIYPHKLVSKSLNQIYFVNQQTLYDFQRSYEKKARVSTKISQTCQNTAVLQINLNSFALQPPSQSVPFAI